MKPMLIMLDLETREVTQSDLTRDECRELHEITADYEQEPVEEPVLRKPTPSPLRMLL